MVDIDRRLVLVLSMPERPSPAHAWFASRLDHLDRQGLRRRLLTITERRPGEICVAGRWLVDFSSNDYLGLSFHPACRDAAAEAVQRDGCSSAASRLVTGSSARHEALERALIHYFGAGVGSGKALIFPSGYQANLGVLTSLLDADDLVFSDAQNHASIVDGCRLSRALVTVYPHGSWETLAEQLTRAAPARRQVIVTDAVFSMDGTFAPLAALRRLADQHGALLVVDEAHSVGVLGPDGRGLCHAAAVVPDVLVGTFSKGLGSHGAFVLCEESLHAWLLNQARALIYTTALPPAILGASQAALDLARGPEGASRRGAVLRLAARLLGSLESAGLRPTGHGTPIVSLGFPDPHSAPALSAALLRDGLLVWAFRPPTVPPGRSQLRICLSASHSEAQIDHLAAGLLHLLTEEPFPLEAP